MKACLSVVFWVSVLSALTIAPASGDMVTMESYGKARGVLDRAIEANGGADALQSLASVRFEYEGGSRAQGQSASFAHDDDWQEGTGRVVVDATQGRSAASYRTTFRGGIPWDVDNVLLAEGSFTVNRQANEAYELSAFDRKLVVGGILGEPSRHFPLLVLREARAAAAGLRWLGQQDFDGVRHDVLTYANPDGMQLTIYVDGDGRLTRLGQLVTFPGTGSAMTVVEYLDVRAENGISLPHRWRVSTKGQVSADWRATAMTVNGELEEADFTLPDGMQYSASPGIFQPQRLAEGVYFSHLWMPMSSSYNTLVVEFEDHLLLMDAPLSDTHSRFYRNFLPKVVGDKPVRYVVATHYHNDHIGGIREYVAHDATVVTTAGNVPFFEQRCADEDDLASIVYEPGSLRPQFELVDGRKVYRDETNEVVVFSIGPTPHVDEMLMAYLPKAKLLYVADLYGTSPQGSGRGTDASTVFLKNKVAELGLEVETIVPGHGLPTAWATFDAAVHAEG